MPEDKDPWRTLQQKMPLYVYDKLLVGLGRVAQANGISPGSFFDDDKNGEYVGPRVQTYELLAILIERSDNENLRV